jgi:hypothetical protein
VSILNTPRGLVYVSILDTYGRAIRAVPYVSIFDTVRVDFRHGILFFALGPIDEQCAVPAVEIACRCYMRPPIIEGRVLSEAVMIGYSATLDPEKPPGGLAQESEMFVLGIPAYNRPGRHTDGFRSVAIG